MHASTVLQIHRDRVRPGREAVYRAVEEEAARLCVEHGCPHPHLAIESLAGPVEVWWLNAFESEADRERVVAAYASNGPLSAALAEIHGRRQGLLESDIDVFAQYKPHMSRGVQLTVRGTRFMAVTVTRGDDLPDGAVFETSDGTRYVFAPTTTAETALASGVEDTIVFAVRPYWGMPAREWIAADVEFWKSNPTASLR
jgi:hypothetical protein